MLGYLTLDPIQEEIRNNLDIVTIADEKKKNS